MYWTIVFYLMVVSYLVGDSINHVHSLCFKHLSHPICMMLVETKFDSIVYLYIIEFHSIALHFYCYLLALSHTQVPKTNKDIC